MILFACFTFVAVVSFAAGMCAALTALAITAAAQPDPATRPVLYDWAEDEELR